MIEVRIRHHTESRSVYLCTWPATALDTLIPTLNAWGVMHVGTGDESSAVDNELSGSIQADLHGGYFEVVIGGPDE